jgi:hypothetical protein
VRSTSDTRNSADRAPPRRGRPAPGPQGPQGPAAWALRPSTSLTAKENPSWRFNGDNAYYPPQPIWGFEGNTAGATTPGPTIHAQYGKPIVCRIWNGLPEFHAGFGSPEISTHLHNMHTPSESDGFAGDYYSRTKKGPTLSAAGAFKDHFYPNVCAGLEEFGGFGDPREALGSLFYHDHTEGMTAPNVVRGLVGRYNVFDALDTGSELTGLRLPSGPYDYPLTFGDRRFDVNGRLTFDQLNPEGRGGRQGAGQRQDRTGAARRAAQVSLPPAQCRPDALLPAGTCRTRAPTGSSPSPTLRTMATCCRTRCTNQTSVRIAPAERADIVIDFARFPLGTELYIVNQLQQTIDTPARQAAGTRHPAAEVHRGSQPTGARQRAWSPACCDRCGRCPPTRSWRRCRFAASTSTARAACGR